MRNIGFFFLTLFCLSLLGACSSSSDPAPTTDATTGDTTGDPPDDTTGDPSDDTTGDPSDDDTGGGSQASVECIAPGNGIITSRTAETCTDIAFGFFQSGPANAQTEGTVIIARLSDQLTGAFNTLSTAYQSVSGPVCQWVQEGVDEFVPAADPGPLNESLQNFQNIVTLSAGESLLFADLSGNSLGELALQSESFQGLTFNLYPGPGNLMLPPGQAVRMTSTGGDIPVKSVDFEIAPDLQWNPVVDSSEKVPGPYTWSASYSGTPLNNVVARLMHFNFDVQEAGEGGRKFNYDCTLPDPSVGMHVPEVLDGLNLDGATVSGFQASIEHITAQVVQGVLVLLISQYAI